MTSNTNTAKADRGGDLQHIRLFIWQRDVALEHIGKRSAHLGTLDHGGPHGPHALATRPSAARSIVNECGGKMK